MARLEHQRRPVPSINPVVNVREVSDLIQDRLRQTGIQEVTAVEAAAWLDIAGALRDSPHRPGLPLRNLLRSGQIRGGEQRPPSRNGRWFITRVDPERTSADSERRPVGEVLEGLTIHPLGI